MPNLRSAAMFTQTKISTAKLSEDGKLIVDAINRHLLEMKQEFIEKLEEKNKLVEDLRIEVDTLKLKVSNMEEKLDDADAYERRDTLLFSGSDVPHGSDGENCANIVIDLVKDKLKLNLQRSDLSVCHRLGRKPVSQQPDKRNIVVKLCRRDLKADILYACRQVKPNMYVNESLTPIRGTIMYVLRQMKKKFPDKVSGCSSLDGKVFAWVRPAGPAVAGSRNVRWPINSLLKLQQFSTDVLNTPLTSFIETWPH
jgi:hypothetical protein